MSALIDDVSVKSEIEESRKVINSILSGNLNLNGNANGNANGNGNGNPDSSLPSSLPSDVNVNGTESDAMPQFNPKKMAKKLRNDPKAQQLISQFQQGQLQSGALSSLTPRERLQRIREQKESARLGQKAKVHRDNVKKETIAAKIEAIHKKQETISETPSQSTLNATDLAVDATVAAKKYSQRIKKLQKKYGVVDLSVYTTELENDRDGVYQHIRDRAKNIIELYNYQQRNTVVTEKVMSFDSSDSDEE
jgi:hypothetical protein